MTWNVMRMRTATALSVMSVAVGAAMFAKAVPASAAAGTPPAWEQTPDLAGIFTFVPPLRHPLPAGWQPTLFWWQAPLSFDNPAKLKEELQGLSARGILPCVGLSAEYYDFSVSPSTPESLAKATAETDKSVAAAKAVADAGYPVHIQMLGALDLYRTPGAVGGKLVVHADSPDAGQKGDVGNEFPCLLLKDGWKARAEHIRGLFKKFADAKVPVAAVWYDYESYPYVWNGMMGHIQRCPSCAKEFKDIPAVQPRTDLPPGCDGFDQWVGWSANFYAKAIAEGFAKPVREIFPQAKVGFYGFTLSSAASPTGGSEANPPEIDVIQPIFYAQPGGFASSYTFAKGASQGALQRRDLDQAYFLGSLLGPIVKNLRPNQMMVPFVGGYVDGNEFTPRMSRAVYREALRHLILRGARGFYCFNTAPPYTPMTYYYTELADINVVYNELLAYKDFLEGGEPLNLKGVVPLTETTDKADWRIPTNTTTWSYGATINNLRVWLPAPKAKDASIWSGVAKGDKAIVRVVTVGPAPKFMDVTPFPDVTVRLLAPPTGATYIVERSGRFEPAE